MGFAQEFKDFNDAWETGSRIRLNTANAKRAEEKLFNEKDRDATPSTFDQPGVGGGGVGTTTAPQTSSGGQGEGGGFKPTEKDIAAWTDYIGQGAAKRGMDPKIAIQVARSEGLAPGIWQSNLDYKGSRETSYGPFQMFTGGGLGNAFQKDTGLDPADPKNVLQTIDYALDHAKQNGWGAWHGWKGDPFAGINRSGRSDASPYTYTPTGEAAPVASSDFMDVQAKGIPDEEGSGEAAQAPAEDNAVQVQEAQIDVPAWQARQLTNPAVELEEWVPGMRRGGAIPDDSTSFATGGSVADLYKTSAAMNQQATPQRVGANSGAAAARITPTTNGAAARITPTGGSTTGGTAVPDWRSWGSTGSPSQQTFRSRPVAAAPAAAAAPAPVDNSAALQDLYRERSSYLAGKQSTGGSQSVGMQNSVARSWDAKLSDVDRRIAELGGNTNYAGGGTVPDFNDWVGRETRMSGRAEEAGQGARDQAARRMNMKERGIDSTAYKPRAEQFPARPAAPAQKPSLFKTPPPAKTAGGGNPKASGEQPPPIPDWMLTEDRPARAGEETGGWTQRRVTNYDSPNAAAAAAPRIHAANNPHPNSNSNTITPSDAPAPELLETPRVVLDPIRDEETGAYFGGTDRSMGTGRNFARGGAIPDDDGFRSNIRSQRAESSNLGPKKAKARRSDPWEGMRTKESKPVRKPKAQGSRNQGKRAKPKAGPKAAGPEYRSTPADGRAPLPTARPDPTTGAPSPIPTPTPAPRPLRQPAGTPSLPYDQRGQITETGNRGAPGQKDDSFMARRGTPGAMTPSTKMGQTTRPPYPNEGSAVASGNQGAPGRAVRQLPNAVPQGQPVAGTSVRPTTGAPPTVPGYGQRQDRGILHAGLSTIADFIDMLSPEDYARPVDDLNQLNVQPPMASGGPSYRKGGYVNSPPNPGSTRALNPIKQMPPDVRKYAIPDDER